MTERPISSWFDEANVYATPDSGSTVSPTEVSNLFHWDGAAWVESVLWHWNGVAWEELQAEVQYWDGAAWDT